MNSKTHEKKISRATKYPEVNETVLHCYTQALSKA